MFSIYTIKMVCMGLKVVNGRKLFAICVYRGLHLRGAGVVVCNYKPRISYKPHISLKF